MRANGKSFAHMSLIMMLLTSAPSEAGGWCSFAAGEYDVVSHGTKSDNVWLTGKFVGTDASIWVPISTPSYGKNNVALAIAAQLAGQGLSVYLDGENDTCASYVTWSGLIRHVKINN